MTVTGYNLFCKEYGMKNLKETGRAWRELSESKKEEWRKIAKKRNMKSKIVVDQFSLDISTERCSICLENMDTLTILLCGHEFHKECIDKWRKTIEDDTCECCRIENMKCPLCRERIEYGPSNKTINDEIDIVYKMVMNKESITLSERLINILMNIDDERVNAIKKYIGFSIDLSSSPVSIFVNLSQICFWRAEY
jgi:hypothetical protein